MALYENVESLFDLAVSSSGAEITIKLGGQQMTVPYEAFMELRQNIENMVESNEYREALEDMVYQFAYRIDGKGRIPPRLGNMGLSALEHAFSVLGWDNAQDMPDSSCDIKRCQRWPHAGVPFPNGDYLSLCSEHRAMMEIGDSTLINNKRPDRGYDAEERKKRLERFGSKPA